MCSSSMDKSSKVADTQIFICLNSEFENQFHSGLSLVGLHICTVMHDQKYSVNVILGCQVGIKDSSYDQYDQTKSVYCATNPCLYSSLPHDSSNVIGCMHCPHAIHAYFSV